MATLDSIRSNSLFAHHYFANYLPASSMMSLWRTNRAWHQTVDNWRSKGILSKRVKLALEGLGLGDPFLQALNQSNGIISGSFVLATIEGSGWSIGDLDIYRPILQTGSRMELIDSHSGDRFFPFYCQMENRMETSVLSNICLISDKLQAVEKFLWNLTVQYHKNFNYTYYSDLSEFVVRNYRKPNRSGGHDIYQVILVSGAQETNVSHIANEWINRHYDLDFLKNSFGVSGLQVNCVNSLITGVSNYYPNNWQEQLLTCHINRISKYRLRGFIIEGVEERQQEIGGVRLKVYYNNGKLWGVRIHYNNAVEVAKLIVASAPSSFKFTTDSITPNSAIIKNYLVIIGYFLLLHLYSVIASWLTHGENYEQKRRYCYNQLNTMFGRFDRCFKDNFNPDDIYISSIDEIVTSEQDLESGDLPLLYNELADD